MNPKKLVKLFLKTSEKVFSPPCEDGRAGDSAFDKTSDLSLWTIATLAPNLQQYSIFHKLRKHTRLPFQWKVKVLLGGQLPLADQGHLIRGPHRKALVGSLTHKIGLPKVVHDTVSWSGIANKGIKKPMFKGQDLRSAMEASMGEQNNVLSIDSLFVSLLKL